MRPDPDELSRLLSIGNLVKLPVQDTNDEGMFVGLEVQVDIINIGPIAIDVPFTVTWSLLDGQGGIYGSAIRQIDRTMQPGDSEKVTLIMSFPAISSLSGLQDAVTLDLVPL